MYTKWCITSSDSSRLSKISSGKLYQSPMDSPHKRLVIWSFDFSLLLVLTSYWTNSKVAGDLRCADAHCDDSLTFAHSSIYKMHDLLRQLCHNLGMGSANERWCYNVTSSLTGLAHNQNAHSHALNISCLIRLRYGICTAEQDIVDY